MDNETYRHVFEEVSEGVVLFDSEQRIVFCNHAFSRMFGLAEADFPDAFYQIVQGEILDPDITAAINSATQEGNEFSQQIPRYLPNGKRLWSDISFKPMADGNENSFQFVGFCRDITAIKEAKERIVDLEREYDFIVENVLAGVIIHNPDSTVRSINSKAREMLGLDEATVVDVGAGSPNFKFMRADGTDLPPEETPVLRAIKERSIIRDVVVGYSRPPDGQVVWALCNAFLSTDERGEITAVLVSFTDVSRLIESEIEANAYRERFELAARAGQDVVFEWNLATGQFFANEAFEAVYGYTPPVIIGPEHADTKGTFDGQVGVFSPDVLAAISSGATRVSVDHLIARPDGSTGHIVIRAFIERASDGTALRVIGTATDVGQLTSALQALEDSETRFRIIADTVSDVLWDHNCDTGETWVTPDWAERLNLYDQDLACPFGLWNDYLDPADQTRVTESYDAALTSDAGRWEIEFQLPTNNDKKIDLTIKASILRHADGRPRRVLGNVRDMTRIKREQEGYTHSRALEAVGQLTGGVAHDFNNLLMIIQGNAELLEMSALSKDDADCVELISRATESAAVLTGRLLAFSGKTRLEPLCVNLPEFLDKVWPLLRAGLPESIAIQRDVPWDIWKPFVDVNSLEQALVNLAVNAKDAMPRGGKIWITCENHEIRANAVPNASGLEAGQYVSVSVSDTGSGMPVNVQKQAFEPYFTTKEIGKGTGLGLSTIYGFAKQAGGAVTISSAEGSGTIITLYLPARRQLEPDPVQEFSDVGRELALGKGRILVVEDEPDVRSHVVRLLERLGYTVTSAEHAIQALEILKEDQEFDLLYTDIIMPGGMDGEQLSEEAAKIAPHMKVLFTSGYPATAFDRLVPEDQNRINILRKPYKAEQLREAVARVLLS